jgi:hypothetical protein
LVTADPIGIGFGEDPHNMLAQDQANDDETATSYPRKRCRFFYKTSLAESATPSIV